LLPLGGERLLPGRFADHAFEIGPPARQMHAATIERELPVEDVDTDIAEFARRGRVAATTGKKDNQQYRYRGFHVMHSVANTPGEGRINSFRLQERFGQPTMTKDRQLGVVKSTHEFSHEFTMLIPSPISRPSWWWVWDAGAGVAVGR
jgi:hypothetical protein